MPTPNTTCRVSVPTVQITFVCSVVQNSEPMMKLVLAKWAADQVLAGGDPARVASDAIHYLHRRLHGHGGLILLDAKGRFGLAHNTPRMAWAVRTAEKQDHGIKIESTPALQPLP